MIKKIEGYLYDYTIDEYGNIYDHTNNKKVNPNKSCQGKNIPTVNLYIEYISRNNIKRHKLKLPLLVYQYFGKTILPDTHHISWGFKNGDMSDCSIDNIAPLYSIHDIDRCFNFYKETCKLFCESNGMDFKYLTESIFKNISDEMIKTISFNTNTLITTSESFLSHPLRRAVNEYNKENKTKYKSSVETLLKIKNIDLNELYCERNSKIFVSNSGLRCDSRVECFVANVLYDIGFIDNSFVKMNLKQLTGEDYNYEPDFYNFIDYGHRYVIEVFGFDDNPNDEFLKVYNEIAGVKKKIYNDIGLKLIPLHTHGKKYELIINELNNLLIEENIINNPIVYDEKFIPHNKNYNIVDKLNKIKDNVGVYTCDHLEINHNEIHMDLRNYLRRGDVTMEDWLIDNVFPEIKNETSNRKRQKINHYLNNQKTILELKNLNMSYELVSNFFDDNTALYWRVFRYCRSLNKDVYTLLYDLGIVKRKGINQFY
jgi:hypothetical protein